MVELKSSHSQMFFKIRTLKNFTMFTGKQGWSLFLIKLQTFRPVTLLKRDSITDAFVHQRKPAKRSAFKRDFSGFSSSFTQKQPAVVFYKKGVLKNSQNSQENSCAIVSFLLKLQAEACSFVKRGTLTQVFSCEFCEIFKNTLFTEHHLVTASV